MVHRKATPKARRERVSMDTTTPPQQQHEVANADEETSAVKTKTKKGSRRGSRDSSTIDSPRRKETKHSAGGKAKRSKTESQGAFPEHRRVIPLTEELREAILAAHSSGVVLKKLKPEFHPDLKVEKRVPAEATTTTTTPSPQPAPAESKALRELVTLQGMYIKLKDLALHQHTDITRLQAENQAVNAALQRTLAKCNLYKQQLDYQMQRQQQQRASNQFQSVDHSRGSANTIALLQQLAASGAMDTSGTQQPSASASPIHLGAFSATVPSASSVPSLFPVLRQDSFGEATPQLPQTAQMSPTIGNANLSHLLRQNMPFNEPNRPSPPPFTLPTLPSARFDASGQLQTSPQAGSGEPNKIFNTAAGSGEHHQSYTSSPSLNGSAMSTPDSGLPPSDQGGPGAPEDRPAEASTTVAAPPIDQSTVADAETKPGCGEETEVV